MSVPSSLNFCHAAGVGIVQWAWETQLVCTDLEKKRRQVFKVWTCWQEKSPTHWNVCVAISYTAPKFWSANSYTSTCHPLEFWNFDKCTWKASSFLWIISKNGDTCFRQYLEITQPYLEGEEDSWNMLRGTGLFELRQQIDCQISWVTFSHRFVFCKKALLQLFFSALH
jgi:hypothetical protein